MATLHPGHKSLLHGGTWLELWEPPTDDMATRTHGSICSSTKSAPTLGAGISGLSLLASFLELKQIMLLRVNCGLKKWSIDQYIISCTYIYIQKLPQLVQFKQCKFVFWIWQLPLHVTACWSEFYSANLRAGVTNVATCSTLLWNVWAQSEVH